MFATRGKHSELSREEDVMPIPPFLAAALASCKMELRLEPDEYAQALYLATAPHPPFHIEARFDTSKVWGVRETVKAMIAEHGTRGVKKWQAKAVQYAEEMESREPDEGHWRTHLAHWQWCRDQVHRAFRKRKPRTRKVEPVALIDSPLW